MNRLENKFPLKGEATLNYGDGDFQIVSPGDFVRCAVTGQTISLDELRYWSVELQQAYVNAEVSLERERETRARRG